jgi:hypothetical protein
MLRGSDSLEDYPTADSLEDNPTVWIVWYRGAIKKTRLSISTEPGFYFEIRCSRLIVRDQPVWTSFIENRFGSRYHSDPRGTTF